MTNPRLAALTSEDRWVVGIYDMALRLLSLASLCSRQNLVDIIELLSQPGVSRFDDEQEQEALRLVMEMFMVFRDEQEERNAKEQT